MLSRCRAETSAARRGVDLICRYMTMRANPPPHKRDVFVLVSDFRRYYFCLIFIWSIVICILLWRILDISYNTHE